MIIKDLGAVSAYAYAVEKGYTGTEEEFATLMASYATVAEEAAESAESASTSATSASTSAQTATTKASEATTAAQTATAKAEEAQADADAAALDASQALSAASTATTKASEAAQSASDAVTAKTAAQTAQTAAEGSATTAQAAAQTATQKAAEAAESARTLTIDPTLSKSGQAADAKATGAAIDELKDDLSKSVGDLQTIISNIKNLSEKCVHHDNFSRSMSGYEIGKNSEGSLTDNSYDTVTGATSDDGVRVDYGLTIQADRSRTTNFTVRKIAAKHSSNFMVEFNTPSTGEAIYIIYKLTDATNFEAININYNGTYYGCIQRTIVNGSFNQIVDQKNIYDSNGYVMQLYFIGGIVAVFIDGKHCYSFKADDIGEYIYIGAYKGTTAHYDFINVFDMITPLVYNTEYLTDSGVQSLPDSTLSAHENRYALDDSVTRFSNKSEHFVLYSTDEKISNGRRTERSLVALIPENLRTMRYEFDVLFPENVLPDTATGSYSDIFFQTHDRQTGVSRGHVPFDLSLVGDEIWLSQYASAQQASGTLDQITNGFVCGKVNYDKWMHFELFIKERYEERQHPFMELKIDGTVVYQSRKPNCANDVKGSSAQYGEYKNNWNLITESNRYFDNFKVTY